jgi:hypothetical protein
MVTEGDNRETYHTIDGTITDTTYSRRPFILSMAIVTSLSVTTRCRIARELRREILHFVLTARAVRSRHPDDLRLDRLCLDRRRRLAVELDKIDKVAIARPPPARLPPSATPVCLAPAGRGAPPGEDPLAMTSPVAFRR